MLKDNKDLVVKMEDLLTDYIDNCTDKEWEELLNNYNIEDEENYMGEVRENAEETIMAMFENSTEEEQAEMLRFFGKYSK